MISNLSKYKNDLDKLLKLGESMHGDLAFRHAKSEGKLSDEEKKVANALEGKFEEEYQNWYTESASVIRQLIPDRLEEFESLYKGDAKRKSIDSTSYHIQDWLNGIRAGTDIYKKKYYDDFAIIVMRFSTQLKILKAVSGRFESSLFDIRRLFKPTSLTPNLTRRGRWQSTAFREPPGLWRGSYWSGIWVKWLQITTSVFASSTQQ